MARNHALIATRMSWILVFAAIALTGACATDTEPLLCGDDVGYLAGADVELDSLDPALSYDLTIVAAGETVPLARTPADPNPGVPNIPLADGRELSVWMFQQGGENAHILASIIQHHDDVINADWSDVGPSPVTLIVSSGGTELTRETFTPTYSRNYIDGPQCPFHDYAALYLHVPAPP